VDLREGAVEVVDRAEDERGDDCVERRVLERQRLRRRLPNGDAKRARCRTTPRALEHAGHRLGDDELLDRARVVGQVEPCTAPDLEHAALRVRERLAPVLGEMPLHPAPEEVVEGGTDSVAKGRHVR
jgi:hypothetical protein